MTTIVNNQTVLEEFQYQEMEMPTRVHSVIIAVAAVASFIVSLSLCFAIFHFRAWFVEKWFMTEMKKETRRDDDNRDPEMLREDAVVVHDVQFPNEAFQLEGATGITDKPEPSPSIFHDDVFLQEVLTSVADICSPGKSISIQNNNLSQNIHKQSESGELNLLNEYYCVNGVIEDVLDGLVRNDQHVINSPTSIDQTGKFPSLLRRNPSYLEAVRRCREADGPEAIVASTIVNSSLPSGSKWQSTSILDGSSEQTTPSTALKVSRSIITSMIHNSSSLSRAIDDNLGSENVLMTVNAEGSHYVTCNSVAISENVGSPEHSLDHRNSTFGSSGSKWQSTPVQGARTSMDHEHRININNEDGATIMATPSSASKVAQSIITSMIHNSSSLSRAIDEDGGIGGSRGFNDTQTLQSASCDADATCAFAVSYEDEQSVDHGDTVLAGSKWQSTPILDGKSYEGDDSIIASLAMPSSGLHLQVSGSYSPVYSPSLQHRSIHNSFSRSNYSQRSFVSEKGENVCDDISTPAPAKSLSLENNASSMSGELHDPEENYFLKGLLEDVLDDVVLHV